MFGKQSAFPQLGEPHSEMRHLSGMGGQAVSEQDQPLKVGAWHVAGLESDRGWESQQPSNVSIQERRGRGGAFEGRWLRLATLH